MQHVPVTSYFGDRHQIRPLTETVTFVKKVESSLKDLFYVEPSDVVSYIVSTFRGFKITKDSKVILLK